MAQGTVKWFNATKGSPPGIPGRKGTANRRLL